MSNKGAHHSDTEAEQINQLRDILLKEDRNTLMGVHQVLNDKALLAEKISPIVEEHLAYLKQHFPNEYAKIVDKIIEKKLKDSQEELLQIIYPKLGQMITRYIQLQFQLLKENIDNQIKNTVKKLNFFSRLKNRLMGIKESDIVMASLDKAVLEEIFLIQRPSGLLMGNASLETAINRDVVAGMLTAIKAFSEDAFERTNEDLELIQYGTYRILLHTFPNYYFALALTGSISTKESEEFRQNIIDFVAKTDNLLIDDITDEYQSNISQQLDNQFFKLNQHPTKTS
jgi:hypothetical protein